MQLVFSKNCSVNISDCENKFDPFQSSQIWVKDF